MTITDADLRKSLDAIADILKNLAYRIAAIEAQLAHWRPLIEAHEPSPRDTSDKEPGAPRG